MASATLTGDRAPPRAVDVARARIRASEVTMRERLELLHRDAAHRARRRS